MKKTFRINGRKVTIYSRRKKEPLTKKKKAEYDLYGTLFTIIILTGGIVMFMFVFMTAFHNIDLAYNFGNDQPLDHYNLFNNESQTPNELYSSGWKSIFGMLAVYNIIAVCFIALYSTNLAEKYHKYRKRFR